MIPRVHTISVEIPPGEELCITPLSDVHIESSAFDLEAFTTTMKARAKLPNHRVIMLGDVMDLVVPRDLKRWRPSAQDSSLAGCDDWVNQSIELAVERIEATGVNVDVVAPGNHEDEFTKRHGVDVTSILAHRLGAVRGGYSGVVRYRLTTAGVHHTQLLTLAYHHGAWGGRLVKGFGGARDWFRAWDGWHFALYGHNHQTVVNSESKFRVSRTGELVEYPVYYVCCGTWVESYSPDAKTTHYAERAGHMPTIRKTPLLRARMVNHGGKARKSGPRGWELQYAVEL